MSDQTHKNLVLALITDFVYEIQHIPKSQELTVHHDLLNKTRVAGCSQSSFNPCENPVIPPTKPDLMSKGKLGQHKKNLLW